MTISLIVFAIIHICAALQFHFDLSTPQTPISLFMSNTSALNATSLVQSRLTALYEDANVQDAFDQTFSSSCEVRLDHEVYPLQTFRDDLAAQRATATQVTVAWDADIISTNDSKPEAPAVVAGALVVTRFLPFRIRVSQAQRRTYIHFSAKIEQDASVQNQRRITSFYYTSVDRTPPIHLNAPRGSQEGGSDGQ